MGTVDEFKDKRGVEKIPLDIGEAYGDVSIEWQEWTVSLGPRPVTNGSREARTKRPKNSKP